MSLQGRIAQLARATVLLEARVLVEKEMRISLKYIGPLLSSTGSKTHVQNKNRIRWYLSDQLERALMAADFSQAVEQGLLQREPIEEGHLAPLRALIFGR